MVGVTAEAHCTLRQVHDHAHLHPDVACTTQLTMGTHATHSRVLDPSAAPPTRQTCSIRNNAPLTPGACPYHPIPQDQSHILLCSPAHDNSLKCMALFVAQIQQQCSDHQDVAWQAPSERSSTSKQQRQYMKTHQDQRKGCTIQPLRQSRLQKQHAHAAAIVPPTQTHIFMTPSFLHRCNVECAVLDISQASVPSSAYCRLRQPAPPSHTYCHYK